MKFIPEFANNRPAMVSTLRLWLVFLTCAGVAAVLIAALQRAEGALSRTLGPPLATATTGTPPAGSATPDRPSMAPTAFTPTFADAAESMRAGRYADAYGRFVALADEGDVNAARIALVMHRFGPDVFGSAWDASPDQLAEWTRQSAAAAEKELEHLRAETTGSGAGTAADNRVRPLASVTRSR